MIEKYNYSPILKTTDAELRGFDQLSDDVKDSIFPIFELTRSRKTKNNPERTVEKRMDSLKDILGSDRPFILDVTAHEDLMNEEIENLGNEVQGFANWCEFVKAYKTKEHLNLIPVIHMLPPEYDAEDDVKTQIQNLSESFDLLAFRFAPFDYAEDPTSLPTIEELSDELDSYLKIISGTLNFNRLIFILDAQYIDQFKFNKKLDVLKQLISRLELFNEPKKTIILSSSFPIYVVGHEDGCEDDEGSITIHEKNFYQRLANESSIALTYGDYGSIHPHRLKAGGGNWVPRIDYPLNNNIIYKRFRRDDGGYILCANEMIIEEDFLDNQVNCWGLEQIHHAVNDEPVGKSPAFWISVRINLFISRLILKKEVPTS